MSSFLSSPTTVPTTEVKPSTAMGGLGFDWLMVSLSLIFLGGLYLDGWAHNHGRVDQSFFTPWHAFFYGGFALTALVLLGTVVINRLRGHDFYTAIPTGYKSTLTGLMIFAAGGVGDLVWHMLFGIEEDIEALFSPTHLMLGIGLVLVVTGPLRAAWQRPRSAPGWQALGPAVLSLSLLISTLTFFQMFAHPISTIIGGARHYHFFDDVGTMAGILALIVMAALLVGPVLLGIWRWQLPLGSLTLIWGLNTLGMTWLDYEHSYTLWMALAMIGAALLLDLIYWRMHPSGQKPTALRIFAFTAPVLLFGAYYAVLAVTEGIGWSVHLWTGSLFLAGVTTLLLSYLLVPPAIPSGAAQKELRNLREM